MEITITKWLADEEETWPPPYCQIESKRCLMYFLFRSSKIQTLLYVKKGKIKSSYWQTKKYERKVVQICVGRGMKKISCHTQLGRQKQHFCTNSTKMFLYKRSYKSVKGKKNIVVQMAIE